METSLSHYRLVEQIGAGAMGVVFRAHDEHLDCDVALKLLPPGARGDQSARKRFRKEALALSKLNHPNIAIVHDFDTQGDTDFLVEELIPGLSVDQMLVTGALPEAQIVQLGTQLADGLEAAHRQGVIHRDLKPANIRVTPEGRLKILDFGLARILHPESGTARTATDTATKFAGTLPYMAPEQVLGVPVDARTDVWAAGCVLYEMATAQRVFPQSGGALVDSILHQVPTPPSRLNRTVSPALEAIILKCLEKDPTLRYASAREIGVDLLRLSSRPVVVAAPAPRRRPWRKPIAAAALVALFAAGFAAQRWWQTHPTPGPTAPVETSIAVIPFTDMSATHDQEYFSDGLAEEILNTLTKVQGLRVAARSSSFQFKPNDQDVRVMGQKLNVGAILEGSVRRDRQRVRITVQLINVADGFQLWSDSYDRELTDIFALQEEIAVAVARSLKLELLGTGKHAPAGYQNVEAYNAHLQGRYFLPRRDRESEEKAIEYFQRAIKLDPDFAQAWAGLAEAHTNLADNGYVNADDAYRQARQAVERALLLDPDSVEAHNVMGWIKRVHDWDWSGAEAETQRALALEPSNADAVSRAGGLAASLGRFDESVIFQRRAAELDPLSVYPRRDLGQALMYAGHYAEAIPAYQKVLELQPQFPCGSAYLGRAYLLNGQPDEAFAAMQRESDPGWRLYGLALAYHRLGKKAEADAALAEFIHKFGDTWGFQLAEIYAYRGESDAAFDWLDRAYRARDSGLSEFKGDPFLKNLEADARYPAFLQRLGLPK